MAFKRILCALDFSKESQAAFDRAAEMARLSGAQLFALHALEAQPVISQWYPMENLGEIAVELQEKAKEAMDALLHSFQQRLEGVEVITSITSGRGFEEILENARVWEADLIVMGARGSAGVESILMGSTAERVVKGADCSVLVVKSG